MMQPCSNAADFDGAPKQKKIQQLRLSAGLNQRILSFAVRHVQKTRLNSEDIHVQLDNQ